jgi:hypothetical protein
VKKVPLKDKVELPPEFEKFQRDYPWEEITKNPIFLLQSKQFSPDRYSAEEHEITFDPNLDYQAIDKEGNEVNNEKLLELGVYILDWKIESVFLTRKEGEAYGERMHYHYPNGWRVYCIPCTGKLAELLELFTVYKKPEEPQDDK